MAENVISDLRPCPMGHTEVLEHDKPEHMSWVYCDICGYTGPPCRSMEEAIIRWNCRPGEDAARQEQFEKEGVCIWKREDPDGTIYDTSCGQAFEFNVNGPIENDLLYCAYCGKRLAEVKNVK